MRRKVIIWLPIIIASFALLFQMLSSWIQFKDFENKTDTQKIERIMENIRLRIENKFPEIKIKPQFKVKIKDFDFTINTAISESDPGTMNSAIWSYKPGKYCLSSSVEGIAILEILESQLDEILKNKNQDMIIAVEAIGSADALLWHKKTYYDGLLGDLYGVKYYRLNDPITPLYETFITGETLMTNEKLALLRAYDVIKYLKLKYSIEDKNIMIFTREFDKVGPEYRRLDLQITIRNAFTKDYENLDWGAKYFVDKNIKH
jgi:hypothetical protein